MLKDYKLENTVVNSKVSLEAHKLVDLAKILKSKVKSLRVIKKSSTVVRLMLDDLRFQDILKTSLHQEAVKEVLIALIEDKPTDYRLALGSHEGVEGTFWVIYPPNSDQGISVEDYLTSKTD